MPDRVRVDCAGAVNRNRSGGSKEHHAVLGSIPGRREEIDRGVDRDRGVVGNSLEHHSLSSFRGSQVVVVAGSVAIEFSFGGRKVNRVSDHAQDAQSFIITDISESGVRPGYIN